MVKGKIKLLKEALRSSKDIQTLDYPGGNPEIDYSEPRFGSGAKYSHVCEGLRGAPKYSEDDCCGCAACESVCTANTIKAEDVNGKRIFTIDLGRCVFCGRCEEECPEDAIKLTTKFELTYTSPAVQSPENIRFERDLILCEKCGNVVAPVKQYDIYSEKVVKNLGEEWREKSKEDVEKARKLCRECRRKNAYTLNLHTRKYY
ncbi:MAG: 4Fe-4S binding protein [Candidatus Odinarchaeota archaeon]